MKQPPLLLVPTQKSSSSILETPPKIFNGESNEKIFSWRSKVKGDKQKAEFENQIAVGQQLKLDTDERSLSWDSLTKTVKVLESKECTSVVMPSNLGFISGRPEELGVNIDREADCQICRILRVHPKESNWETRDRSCFIGYRFRGWQRSLLLALNFQLSKLTEFQERNGCQSAAMEGVKHKGMLSSSAAVTKASNSWELRMQEFDRGFYKNLNEMKVMIGLPTMAYPFIETKGPELESCPFESSEIPSFVVKEDQIDYMPDSTNTDESKSNNNLPMEDREVESHQELAKEYSDLVAHQALDEIPEIQKCPEFNAHEVYDKIPLMKVRLKDDLLEVVPEPANSDSLPFVHLEEEQNQEESIVVKEPRNLIAYQVFKEMMQQDLKQVGLKAFEVSDPKDDALLVVVGKPFMGSVKYVKIYYAMKMCFDPGGKLNCVCDSLKLGLLVLSCYENRKLLGFIRCSYSDSQQFTFDPDITFEQDDLKTREILPFNPSREGALLGVATLDLQYSSVRLVGMLNLVVSNLLVTNVRHNNRTSLLHRIEVRSRFQGFDDFDLGGEYSWITSECQNCTWRGALTDENESIEIMIFNSGGEGYLLGGRVIYILNGGECGFQFSRLIFVEYGELAEIGGKIKIHDQATIDLGITK